MPNKMIWKYSFEEGSVRFAMPEGSEVLSADVQAGRICIWVMFDVEHKRIENFEEREFVVVPTGLGFKYKGSLDFINQVQYPNGEIYHIFEVKGG